MIHGWNSDHSDPTKTSLAFLLTWLTDEDNANTYLGAADSTDKDEVFGDKDGKTKSSLIKDISNIIKATNGVERNVRSIRSKIDFLFDTYRKTKDWTERTGVGVEASTTAENYRQLVQQKFKYFYLLDPILSIRPNFSIPFSTDDVPNSQTKFR